jgi:hypothetical protein
LLESFLFKQQLLLNLLNDLLGHIVQSLKVETLIDLIESFPEVSALLWLFLELFLHVEHFEVVVSALL